MKGCNALLCFLAEIYARGERNQGVEQPPFVPQTDYLMAHCSLRLDFYIPLNKLSFVLSVHHKWMNYSSCFFVAGGANVFM